ncbi:MAG: Transcriptional regulator DauR [Candidatus Erwinia impunctatus]|nr:Transcriptional regulator DauR [Culicoides impunctatus]
MISTSVCDEDNLLAILAATTRGIGSLLPQSTELVLHDLRTPEYSIAEIVNGHVTGRRRGESILAGLRTDKGFLAALQRQDEACTLLLDYQTTNKSGQMLRSSTMLYRTTSGKPFAALCINCDMHAFPQAIALLRQLCPPESPRVTNPLDDDEKPEMPESNIKNLMQTIIGQATERHPGKGRRDIKNANLLAVQRMQERGIFLIKGGVEKAAAALSVTRYTIYNYLDELQASRGEESP